MTGYHGAEDGGVEIAVDPWIAGTAPGRLWLRLPDSTPVRSVGLILT
jgi:hypothetical protein